MTKPMRIVLIESPFATTDLHSKEENIAFATLARNHSIAIMGEAPIVPHLMWATGSWPDRDTCLKLRNAMRRTVDATVVYCRMDDKKEHGMDLTPGILSGVLDAKRIHQHVEYRIVDRYGVVAEDQL